MMTSDGWEEVGRHEEPMMLHHEPATPDWKDGMMLAVMAAFSAFGEQGCRITVETPKGESRLFFLPGRSDV